MKRKIILISFIVTIISLFSISHTFATNNTMENVKNGIRNIVGGTENVLEGAGNTVGNAVKGTMNVMGNSTMNLTNTTDNSRYTATRTSTDIDGTTGISETGYTWFIIGITALAIIVLLWSYFTQKRNNSNYIDSDDN